MEREQQHAVRDLIAYSDYSLELLPRLRERQPVDFREINRTGVHLLHRVAYVARAESRPKRREILRSYPGKLPSRRECVSPARRSSEALAQPPDYPGDSRNIVVLADNKADERFERLLPKNAYARREFAGFFSVSSAERVSMYAE